MVRFWPGDASVWRRYFWAVAGEHVKAGLAALATALTSTILTVQGALAPHWQWTLLPSVAGTVTGLLATAAAGTADIGREEVYEAYDVTAISSTDCGVAVLHAVRSAYLANARALERKDRLTSLTLVCLASTILLVGVLNLASVLGSA